MSDIEKRARELLERHTVAINVAVEDGSCFMVSEQDALDAIRAAITCAASPDSTQTALPPLPPVDGYDKRVQGHYSAEQMRSYARAALTPPDGYVLVPVQPSFEMLSAAAEARGKRGASYEVWLAMIGARPEVK